MREVRVYDNIYPFKFMDDKEYYSLMNRSSSYQLQQALKKKNDQKKKNKSVQSFKNDTYAALELRQGQSDAQMLKEKKEQ